MIILYNVEVHAMINNLKLVIFDMDGLMFDTERFYCDSLQKECDEKNIKINMQALYDVIGSSLPIDMNLFNQSDLSNEELNELTSKNHHDAIEYLYNHGLPIKKGLLELIDVITKKNIRMCVATSSPYERAEKFLKVSNIFDKFDFIISGRDFEHGKPAPDVFLAACAKAHVAPENALVLEDSIIGGKAALAAHIRYIIIPDINPPTQEVADAAYAVLDDLGCVAKLI